jgi:putative membrane protein
VRRRVGDLLIAWLILAAAVVITVAVMPGLEVDDWHAGEIFVFAGVLAVMNLLIGPILKLLSLPIMVATLGLFGLVINAVIFLVADWWRGTIKIDTFTAALAAALVISIVRAALTFLVDRRRA